MSQPRSKVDYARIGQYLNTYGQPIKNIYDKMNYDIAAAPESHKLQKGTTRRNIPAMNKLAEIVGTRGLKQDIRRNHEAQSKIGAEAWIDKRGLKGLYRAVEEDVDHDGIHDVVVRDVNGNLVMINGYSVRDSDFPQRSRYYEIPKEQRETLAETGTRGYKQWFQDEYYKPVYDAEGINVQAWSVDPEKDVRTKLMHERGFKVYTPKKKRSGYQWFVKQIIGNLCDYTFARFNLFTADGKKPNIFIKLAAHIWNNNILIPALMAIYKNDSDTVEAVINDEKRLKKLKNTKEFKAYIDRILYTIYQSPDELNGELFNYIVDVTKQLTEEWYEANPGVDRNPQYGTLNESITFARKVQNSMPQPSGTDV